MTAAQWIAIAAIGLPALAIVLWPLLRGGAGRTVAQSAEPPPDRRLEAATKVTGLGHSRESVREICVG